MKHFLLLLASVFLLAASACSYVTVTEPIGEQPVGLKPEQWEGLWKLYLPSFYGEAEKEAFLMIEVADGDKGVLKVHNIGREPGSVQAYLRESNGWMFGSYNAPDQADNKGMCWGRFEKDGDHIYFWMPDYNRFSDLVTDGLIPGHPYDGESDGDDILILSGLKAEHMKLIASESKGVLFHWDAPFFLVRVSDDMD